ncbi:helix-turn-helix transcriptional regulator [Ruania alkalisoli]|uniref:Helix-turn-helix transcriptional regulator n=1 Tax=Ruania alkalisoli TaxID=2779775 RepID=A0A7M1SPL0_9MICO|nr:helix-turn-helix transcriptional regulator [Ruania alkalisoli]QOR69127.1 helix-turn-helix transcriptional regulator [Ruania alkalisoli]
MDTIENKLTGTPCLARDPHDDGGGVELHYLCTLDKGHDGDHEAMDTHDGTLGHAWSEPVSERRAVAGILREVLTEAGLSQADYARQAGISARTASRRLSGLSRVFVTDLLAVAQLVGLGRMSELVERIECGLAVALSVGPGRPSPAICAECAIAHNALRSEQMASVGGAR